MTKKTFIVEIGVDGIKKLSTYNSFNVLLIYLKLKKTENKHDCDSIRQECWSVLFFSLDQHYFIVVALYFARYCAED